MHRATASGPREIDTPKASRTSADPHLLVMPRLPCLATGTPAAATTKADAVETLKLPLASPPVPQVSTSSSWRSEVTRTAFSRITWAMPASSAEVSPFRRNAVTKAPNWAGDARSSMMSAITAVASATVRSCPSTTLASASTIILVVPPRLGRDGSSTPYLWFALRRLMGVLPKHHRLFLDHRSSDPERSAWSSNKPVFGGRCATLVRGQPCPHFLLRSHGALPMRKLSERWVAPCVPGPRIP